MGDEADADWQDGLIEAGIEDTQRWFADRMESAMRETIMGSTRQPRQSRQTALRARGRGFETIELDDAGSVIEPVRCVCGASAIIHRSTCPFAYAVT